MDVRVTISVVVSLAVIAAVSVGGIIIVDAIGREPPVNLGTIAGTCVGALAMLLVHAASRPAVVPTTVVGNTITGPK